MKRLSLVLSHGLSRHVFFMHNGPSPVPLRTRSGEALIGASVVVVQGTTTGAVTDLDGQYSDLKFPKDSDVLEISYTGYSY